MKFRLKRRAAGQGLTGVQWSNDGAGLATVEMAHDRPRLLAAEFIGCDTETGGYEALQALVSRRGLRQARCTTVLEPEDYALVLTETPPVEEAELPAALGWKIRDMIDFPIAEAVVEIFDAPSLPATGSPRSVYVVAARTETVRARVGGLTRAGFAPEIIDIPELAQRNLAVRLPEDSQGVAVLSLGRRRGLLTITRGGVLYLSRRLELRLTDLARPDPQAGLDHIVLEVQRSLDFFESQYREAPVRTLVVAPVSEPVTNLIDYLAANLSVTVRLFQLEDVMDCAPDLDPDTAANCWIAIGAALRREKP